MRSTPELIAELEEEGGKHWFATLPVAFESSTVFVDAKDAGRLELLNNAISAGGTPIGLIVADKTASGMTMKYRVYPEHTGEAVVQAEKYLDKLLAGLKKRWQKEGLVE